MADNKKSFVLYCDLLHTVNKLPDDKAGKLFKHILEYVNDTNPQTDDVLVDVSFEPIKQQLKRDLQKYQNICERNRTNGKKGGRPKKPTGLSGNPKKPKKADSDNDNDSDNEINTNIYRAFKHLKITQDENKKLLKDFTQPQIDDTLDQIENFKGNKKYNSLYLTSLNWLKRNHPTKDSIPLTPLTNDVLHVARSSKEYAKTLFDKGHSKQLEQEGILWK